MWSPRLCVPVVLLVRDHSVIPHVRVAQSTSEIDWKNVELRVFSTDGAAASGLFALPRGKLQSLDLRNAPSGYVLRADPLRDQVKWQITRVPAQ